MRKRGNVYKKTLEESKITDFTVVVLLLILLCYLFYGVVCFVNCMYIHYPEVQREYDMHVSYLESQCKNGGGIYEYCEKSRHYTSFSLGFKVLGTVVDEFIEQISIHNIVLWFIAHPNISFFAAIIFYFIVLPSGYYMLRKLNSFCSIPLSIKKYYDEEDKGPRVNSQGKKEY